MLALTSVLCTLMVASGTVIQDAPCHDECAEIAAVLPEETQGSITPPLSKSQVTQTDAEGKLYEEKDLRQLDSNLELSAPKVLAPETKILFKAPEVTANPLPANPPISQLPATDSKVVVTEKAKAPPPAVLEERETRIDMGKVFAGAPVIYSILLLMSLAGFALWLYHFLLTKNKELMPENFSKEVENQLATGNWQEALVLCRKEPNLLSNMITAAIAARHEGSQAMIERMQAEGKRSTSYFWQRLSLLNDIALIAPMIGLLGTVLGMFYAFYDVNRSIESMYTLFDGLGISVGTTVGGLIVSIMALFFQSTLKYRLVRQLALVDAKAQQIALHPIAVPLHNVHLRDPHELST